MKLIDAGALKSRLKKQDARTFAIEELNLLIDFAPCVDAEPVRHGHWEVIDAEEPRRYGCSECKRLSWNMGNYCPNCGARMDGESDE